MSEPRDLERLLRSAASAAERGGEVIARSVDPARHATTKAPGDYVTDVDRESEATIARHLTELEPGIPIVGEEGGGERSSGRYWLVDPLDGTTNFLHRFVAVGVSVALIEDGRPIVGAVHAPLLGATWTAGRGLGAWRADVRLHVGERTPATAVVGTGLPFRRKHLLPRYLAAFGAAFSAFEDLRRPGAAALDLAWTAEGVFDGFFELELGPWDVAAGTILVEEAGGVVTDWEGRRRPLSGDVLAGSPEVHATLLEIASRWSRPSATHDDELEAALRALLSATDSVRRIEGSPRTLADLSSARIRAREALQRLP